MGEMKPWSARCFQELVNLLTFAIGSDIMCDLRNDIRLRKHLGVIGNDRALIKLLRHTFSGFENSACEFTGSLGMVHIKWHDSKIA